MSLSENMAPRRPVGLALLLTAVTAVAAPVSAIGDADDPQASLISPASLARIGKQVAQPAGLQIARPQETPPTFRVEVHEHLYWTDEPRANLFNVPPMSALAPPRSPGQPSVGASGAGVGFDPYAAMAGVRHFFQRRAAEKEVREVLAELCVVTVCPAR
jgi:hypothetical protein